MGIEPVQRRDDRTGGRQYTEHRIIDGTAGRLPEHRSDESDQRESPKYEIAVGDQLTLLFADDPRRIAVRLTEATDDLTGGMLSSVSALGKAIREAEEGDEIEFIQEDGTKRRLSIISVGKATPQDLSPVQASTSRKDSITNGSSVLDGEAAHVNHPDNDVIHHEETASGSFRMFKDGSIEIGAAGETRWYRDLAELERSRLSSPFENSSSLRVPR